MPRGPRGSSGRRGREEAYGVTIREELERETPRTIAFGTVYKTLGRMEGKGFLHSRMGEPTGERGGRRKKLYEITPAGLAIARRSVADLRTLTEGLEAAVVSESFARMHYPDGTPLGNRIRVSGRDAPWLEIVGVVGDVTQRPANLMTFITRTSVPPQSLIEVVRSEIQEVDPNQPLVGFQSMEDRAASQLSLPRFRTLLLSSFGAVALLLSVVGLYGVLSYTVSSRTREIGVRIAVGAERGSVLGLVLRDGIPLVATGVVLGAGGALALKGE